MKTLRCLGPGAGGDGDDAEFPGVEPPALRGIQGRTEHVGVVRHLDQECSVHLPVVRVGELEVERLLGASSISGSTALVVSALASR